MKQIDERPARKTFRDKYPAVIILVLALLSFNDLLAQVPQAKYSPINGTGFIYKRHASDSVQMIPLATSPHLPYRKVGIRYNDTCNCIEVWNDTLWSKENYATQLNDSMFVVGRDTITIHGTGGGTPGGSDTYVQINDGGVFGGDAGLVYNKTTNKLTTDSVRAVKGHYDSLGIGTDNPTKALHIAKQSATDGSGTMARIVDTRTSGNYRFGGVQIESDISMTQLLSMNGSGATVQPFNSMNGSYLRNVTANLPWFMTYNKSGTERKSLWLNGDSLGIGYNVTFTSPAFTPVAPGFGGFPVLLGSNATGSGVAVGWYATATNLEATAVGPQAYADGLATIAIGDGTKAMSSTWGGNIGIGGTLTGSNYGNQIVMGDAAYTKGNINYFVGGGMGVDHNFVVALGCQGSSTAYNLSISTADHQGFLGGYAENSPYFNFDASSSGQGVGLANDWWLGGPVTATWPHDISLRVTSLIGTNRNGIAWRLYGSRGTGTGTPGDIELWGATATGSGTTLQDSTKRFTFTGLGKFKIHATPDSAATATGGYLFRDAATGEVKIGPGGTGGGGSYTFSTGLTESSGTVTSNLSTGVSGGQSVVGGTASANALTLSSTSHGTKGKINFGSTGTFDEANKRLVIGTTTVSTTNMLYAEGSNNDGGATTAPAFHFKNTNATAATGSDYNYAGGTFTTGNGAVMGQFMANYGTGATSPFSIGSGFLITTRTDHPIIFATGATTAARMTINNSGVITIPNLAGTGTRMVTADASGNLGTQTIAPVYGDLALVNDADYTVTSSVSAVRYHQTVTSNRVLTIPDAALNAGRELKIKFNGFSSAQVTITSAGGDIYLNGTSGSTTQPVNVPNIALILKSNGTDWYQIN